MKKVSELLKITFFAVFTLAVATTVSSCSKDDEEDNNTEINGGGGGNHDNNDDNDDGGGVIVIECTYCKGDGECERCRGDGLDPMGDICEYCDGSGVCRFCGGSGELIFDDCNLVIVVLLENSIDERRFARPQKTRENGDGNIRSLSFFNHHVFNASLNYGRTKMRSPFRYSPSGYVIRSG